LLLFAHMVTVVICAVALELCARAAPEMSQQTKTTAVPVVSSLFMESSSYCSVFRLCGLGSGWRRTLDQELKRNHVTKVT
jgi:hypothetical protein